MGWLGFPPSLLSSSPMSSVVVDTFNPKMSSCSSAWGWVLHRMLSLSLSSSFPPPPPPCPPLSVIGRHYHLSFIPCRPTHNPPHGQWLIRVGVGGVSFVVVVVVVVVVVPLSFSVRRSLSPCPLFVICHCSLSPRCSLSCPPSFIVPCCSLSHHCSSSVVVPIPLFIVHPLLFPVVPPTSHPTSSCL
jgi:hypothetical protein